MSFPILNQELTFLPDASTQHSFAYFPDSLRGQYVEMTVYVEFTASSNAGKIQIQTSHRHDTQFVVSPTYGGTWANVGSTIDYAAASSQKYASVTGCFDDLRLDIDTAIGGGGTVRAWVVASAVE
jgi:hypothetical protein